MNRIINHPVLDPLPDSGKQVTFTFEDEQMKGLEGEPIAAALMAAGIMNLRQSHRFKESRGVFCGIGQCQECVMVVDGVPNVRTCITPLKEGMQIRRQTGRGTMGRIINADQ